MSYGTEQYNHIIEKREEVFKLFDEGDTDEVVSTLMKLCYELGYHEHMWAMVSNERSTRKDMEHTTAMVLLYSKLLKLLDEPVE